MSDNLLCEKCCCRCEKRKPTSEFYSDFSKKDGYSSYCRECLKAHVRERRKDPEKRRRAQKYRTVDIGTTVRRCGRCGEYKVLEEFTRSANTKDGYHSYCRECLKEYNQAWGKNQRGVQYRLRSKYGLTPEEHEAMHEEQEGKCAICRLDNGSERSLVVDHCHDTGAVRALLCIQCNAGLGHFDHNPARLRAAASYVERFR